MKGLFVVLALASLFACSDGAATSACRIPDATHRPDVSIMFDDDGATKHFWSWNVGELWAPAGDNYCTASVSIAAQENTDNYPIVWSGTFEVDEDPGTQVFTGRGDVVATQHGMQIGTRRTASIEMVVPR